VTPFEAALASQALLETLIVPWQNCAAFEKHGNGLPPVIPGRTTRFEAARAALDAAVRVFPAFSQAFGFVAARIIIDAAW
jgi:hypothetical protein